MSKNRQTNQQPTQSSNVEKWLPTVIVAVISTMGLIIVALINRSTALKPLEFTQTAQALHPPISMTTQAYLPDLAVTPTPTSIPSIIPTITPTSTPDIISTTIPSPTLTVEDQLVQLIDNYYTCINIANRGSDRDYEVCWNLLSDYPGEYQSHLNKNDFKSTWKKYKVTYALYYCSKYSLDFVDAKYYLYDRNDLSLPIGNGVAYYLEYSFGLDENGWRIKGGDLISDIGSYCERQPRIEKLTLIP